MSQVVIDPQKLSETALDQIIESFVLREGTDYGNTDISLETKKKQVYEQLKKQKLVLLYDTELESCNLLTKVEFQKLNL